MRIAIVFDTPYPDWTPADYAERMVQEIGGDYEIEPEPIYQVGHALESRGHEVLLAGAHTSPDEVTERLREFEPTMVFNLAEGFMAQNRFQDRFDFILPAALELEGHPYTGAGPQALMVTRNKAMSKKVLAHHGLCVPAFTVYRIGETVPRKTADLFFPAIVKPLRLDASEGISQASVVYHRDQLADRVAFIHDKVGDAAIAEQYIEGRELYVTVLGNGRQARCLPTLELVFPADASRPEQRIATKATKWDEKYSAGRGIRAHFARRLSAAAAENLKHTCLTAYRSLWLRDYARFDLRLDADDRVWVLEANANPYLCEGHEAAEAARKAGMAYPEFVERIVQVARRRHRRQRRRQRQRAR